jgi:protoporphyrinogen oxidase
VKLGMRVTQIDLDKHEATLASGDVICYERMLSTMPLTELIRLTGSNEFRAHAERGLKSSASNIFGIGLRGQPPAHLRTKCWMYFPESDCPFYRVTVFSNYSPNNVPDSATHWSLMAEVSESASKPVNAETLGEEVIQGLLNTKLIERRGDIVSFWKHRVQHGYPTPSVHRDEALEAILPEFERCGVSSRGRFGMWKYEVSNQDHSFMQGVEWAEHVLHGKPEMTARDADKANSRKHPWPLT